jgi:hypothetical protein
MSTMDTPAEITRNFEALRLELVRKNPERVSKLIGQLPIEHQIVFMSAMMQPPTRSRTTTITRTRRKS